MKNPFCLLVAPVLIIAALSQLQCSSAFLNSGILGTLNTAHSVAKFAGHRIVYARKHRMATAPRMASTGIKVKNGGLIGNVIPSNWAESKDFIRDGRNLKSGDLVIVARSDGRFVSLYVQQGATVIALCADFLS